MIEIDMPKECAFYKDWEITNYAPSLSWMKERVYVPGRWVERIKTIKQRRIEGRQGSGAKALITL